MDLRPRDRQILSRDDDTAAAARQRMPGLTAGGADCNVRFRGKSGHRLVRCTCLLSGVKRTCLFALHMSAFGPKRTLERIYLVCLAGSRCRKNAHWR